MKTLEIILGIIFGAFALFCFVIPLASVMLDAWLDRKDTKQRTRDLGVTHNPGKYDALKNLSLMALVALYATTARAQTNAVPQNPQSFFNTAESYFTSFDTNSVTFSFPGDLWVAENYRSGVNSSAELGFSFDAWKPSTNISIAPEVVIRNAGIAGTVVSESGGVGLSYRLYDVKVTGYADLGYSEFDSQGYVELGLRAKKALTTHTYAGLGIGIEKLWGASKAPNVNTTSLLPTVTIFTGFTF